MKSKEEVLLSFNESMNGIFTSQDLISHGFSKFDISQFVKKGLLERVSRGNYLYRDALSDDFKLAQQNNQKMIFSNETALYLHEMTGRFPDEFTVTTESGYHLRNQELKVYYVKPELLYLGVMEKETPYGNPVYVYDKERTVCDIIRNKNRIELQVYAEGLQNYFLKGKPDLKKLANYAKAFGMKQKVMEIVTLYMTP